MRPSRRTSAERFTIAERRDLVPTLIGSSAHDPPHLPGAPSREHARCRASGPIIAYHLLLPVLGEFMARCPEIELDLDFSDRIVDLIEEGVDVAIRSGQLPENRLMARAPRPPISTDMPA